MAEFDLVELIRQRTRPRAGARGDIVLGIGDDAALLRMPAGHELVVTADTLNDGVHFPTGTAAADVGWKALAANLSDLASMGARPAWCTLSLSLPEADAAWVEAFLDGFLELAGAHGIALVGGDTTRGPLSIAVTAMGLVESGAALRRDRARAGDDVWVTGTLGDAAGALVLGGYLPPPPAAAPDPAGAAHAISVIEATHAAAVPEAAGSMPPGQPATPSPRAGREAAACLAARLARPTPRVEAGCRLLGLAHACVDVSDGLLADLGHLCERSGVGAELEIAALPASAALRAAFGERRHALQLAGGDDYELCFTAPPSLRDAVLLALEQAGTEGARIGRVVPGAGVRARSEDGHAWLPPRTGYVHFR
ncbi:thiamine-phosphate kinase [Pseudoxanthomonas broegbernensis]|uniref:Thiamine-monophosphate kinase n=1 Tax=Pseudoxanthomonas broegbernensis TaxID=83619 RepID=A0A7V8K6T7_9GAMM|nr:thiamine-phosphate kinase [Pseudoxanthomonas broegbernensis]KAF1686047.1 thiamine-phosphate kinase [Pseudoxanthomonas broegbernensis]MBB6063695.1 thiamine-monophosphate kinase [Pseudoxanthomonas broegbernensis]